MAFDHDTAPWTDIFHSRNRSISCRLSPCRRHWFLFPSSPDLPASHHRLPYSRCTRWMCRRLLSHWPGCPRCSWSCFLYALLFGNISIGADLIVFRRSFRGCHKIVSIFISGNVETIFAVALQLVHIRNSSDTLFTGAGNAIKEIFFTQYRLMTGILFRNGPGIILGVIKGEFSAKSLP